MKIIAICGQKGTGKDTVASLIIDQLSNKEIPYKKISFGDPAKQIVCQAFDLRNDRDYNQFIRSIITLPNGTERTGKSIAKTIQMKLRQGNSKIFIDGIEDSIYEFKGYHPEQFDNVVFLITDLRFKDELKWCRSNNATIIKVKRNGSYFDPLADQPEIDDLFVTDVIDNNGSEQQLADTVASRINLWLQH